MRNRSASRTARTQTRHKHCVAQEKQILPVGHGWNEGSGVREGCGRVASDSITIRSDPGNASGRDASVEVSQPKGEDRHTQDRWRVRCNVMTLKHTHASGTALQARVERVTRLHAHLRQVSEPQTHPMQAPGVAHRFTAGTQTAGVPSESPGGKHARSKHPPFRQGVCETPAQNTGDVNIRLQSTITFTNYELDGR